MSHYGNNMQFKEFQDRLSSHHVFSLPDIKKQFPNFSYRQLDRWEKSGYLKKIRQGFYCFAREESNEEFFYFAANKIYSPSYLSLEKAMKFYGLIPEEIFQITSVGTRKTIGFQTPVGNFSYRQIKPSLYWGYRLMNFGKHNFLMAEPEKAILDYLYLHPKLKTSNDFEELRINQDSFHTQVDLKKFRNYLKNFNNKSMTQRAEIFLTAVKNA